MRLLPKTGRQVCSTRLLRSRALARLMHTTGTRGIGWATLLVFVGFFFARSRAVNEAPWAMISPPARAHFLIDALSSCRSVLFKITIEFRSSKGASEVALSLTPGAIRPGGPSISRMSKDPLGPGSKVYQRSSGSRGQSRISMFFRPFRKVLDLSAHIASCSTDTILASGKVRESTMVLYPGPSSRMPLTSEWRRGRVCAMNVSSSPEIRQNGTVLPRPNSCHCAAGNSPSPGECTGSLLPGLSGKEDW